MKPEHDRSAFRIVDANANRAAEALRVAEDVCRFHWRLPGLARELKALRHRVLETVSAAYRREDLLRARDVEGDVGRGAPSPSAAALDPAAMAFRNLERAREALRTLEEAAKLDRPQAAASLERARYDLYALERALSFLPPRRDARARLASASIYLLATAGLSPRPLTEAVLQAVEAGCDAVQLREKTLPDRELLALARELREITARGGALFFINDRPDLALLARADGVHLGQSDLPVAAAREILGDDALIGVSTHSVAQALEAGRQGADYIGVGPMFPTATKDIPGPPFGPEGLASVLQAVTLPAFAVGGVAPGRLAALAAAGCRRVAVASWLLSSGSIPGAVRALRLGLQAEPDPAGTGGTTG